MRGSGDRRLACAIAAVGVLLLHACSPDAREEPAGPLESTDDGAQEPVVEQGAVDDEEPLPSEEVDQSPVATLRTGQWASGDFPRWEDGPIHLADARLVGLEEFDRLILEFAGQLPSWQIRPVDGPLLEQPGRTEVDLEGESVLEVRLVPVTSIDRGAGEPTALYEGPEHLPSVGGPIREALLTTDASDILVWGIGVGPTPSFAVGVLEDPPRLVIDVAADGA